MDKRTKQYRMLGRYEAKRLFPIATGTACTSCRVAAATDRHHVDGNTHNNTQQNVVFLCHRCHLRRERKDRRVGSRSRLTTAQIQPDFAWKDRRGKPRALSVEQVKSICSHTPTLGRKRAIDYAGMYNVSVATIFAARGRQGCYTDSIYD